MTKIYDVIKYEGDNSTFVWKHPCEDFNTGAQLIVHESQEAIFFMNGQALDLFGPGRHTLETQNIPLVDKFFKRPAGDTSPFHCEVYFINKTEQMAIKWGTDSKVEYIDQTYNFPIQIGASGEMNLRVSDSRKLLVKVVGTELSLGQLKLVQKFRGVLMTRVKTYLTNLIREDEINIFSIDEHLTEISDSLHEKLIPDFIEYGVELVHFFLTTIVKPEENRMYQKFKELHFRQYADVREAQLRQEVGIIDQETESKRMVIESQGLAQKRVTEGYSYQDERKFDVAEKVAQNKGTGEYANMGIGLGMIGGIGGSVGGAVGGIMADTLGLENSNSGNKSKNLDQEKTTCNNCGKNLPQGARFCLECGQKVIKLKEDEVICSNCGEKTPKGKFCIACGSSLIELCSNCGSELPEGSKFCLECGEKVNGGQGND